MVLGLVGHKRTVLLVSLILAAVVYGVYASGNSAGGLWFGSDSDHNISDSTRSMLSAIEEPVHLYLFVSGLQAQNAPLLRSYERRVRGALQQFEVEADGNIVLRILDTPLLSRLAAEFDIPALDVGADGEPIYFGVGGLNKGGLAAGISFHDLKPEKEALLEHSLAHLVYSLASAGIQSDDWPFTTLDGQRPLVIAHRGASGVLPEHTIPAYRLAIDVGSDCIEPDLVMTKDGILVDRHDVFLSRTTDVASRSEFAGRKRYGSGGRYANREDWYVSDFTLAELKSLRAVQAFSGRSKAFDGLYDIPTFAEVLETAAARLTVGGNPVCVYPEAKEPELHRSLGFDMAGELLSVLNQHGFNGENAAVFVQSFDPSFVKTVSERSDIPAVLLIRNEADLEAALAADDPPYWDAIGIPHGMLFDWRGRPTGIVRDSHARGLAVHVWTYRDDAPFWVENAETAIRKALVLGVDGFFTDFPLTGYRIVNELSLESGTLRSGADGLAHRSLVGF